MQNLFRFFFALLAFAIPLEHKYDKPLRFFSKSLIPDGLILPKWFETKIYFYPSDLIAPVLILFAIFAFKVPLRRFFFDRTHSFLWAFFLFGALSIVASPLCHYSLLYIRLWQWLTAIFVFCLAAHKKEFAPTLLRALIAIAILQSLFAIAQYFHQGSFGLRLFGEPEFNRGIKSACALKVPGGYRWIFDRGTLFNTNIIVRVMGTTAHPNVLGGFLALTTLASLGFFNLSQKKWVWSLFIFIQLSAMTLTFSRGAIFAFGVGAIIWFMMHWKHSPHLAKAATLLCFCAVTIGFLFQDQLTHRGGFVNYNELAAGSDAYRLQQQTLSLDMIQRHPFFGVGFQQFSLRAHEFLPIDPTQHVNGVHNIYLMIASEMGLIALVCFLAFLISLFLSIRNAPYSPILASLTAMLIAFLLIGCCDFYPLLFQMGRLLFFITAGLLIAHAKTSETIAQESTL